MIALEDTQMNVDYQRRWVQYSISYILQSPRHTPEMVKPVDKAKVISKIQYLRNNVGINVTRRGPIQYLLYPSKTRPSAQTTKLNWPTLVIPTRARAQLI